MIRYDSTSAAHCRQRFLARVEADVRDCYQCGNCSAGCPAAFTFDYAPNQIMRMLQVGQVDRLLDSRAIQLCVQCLTCTTRCPRNIDIAGIIEDLKTIAAAQERDVPEEVHTFNEAFMGSVARFGRLPELYSMGRFYLGTLNPKLALHDISLMKPMVSKGKMKFVPRKAKGADEVERIYRKTMDRAKAREKAGAGCGAPARAAALQGTAGSGGRP